MRTKIAIMALAAVAFTACNKNETSTEVSRYITVDASVGDLSTRATATAFVPGDAVSIYAWTGSNAVVGTPLAVDNSVNTYDGTKWTATPQMLWKDPTTTHYFLGVYPSKAITNFTADAYTTPTDVLVATVLGGGRTASGGIVPMTFDHVMSKLVVNLTFRSQWSTPPTVTRVTTSAMASSTVNYLAKTTTTTGEKVDVSFTATTANTAYAIVVAPQSIQKVDILIGGITYTYTHSTDIVLAKGAIQTLNLIVGREKVELGSIVINDWTTGETIEEGEALN